MRRILIFGALTLCLSLSSCRCADPPPVGPVEDEDEARLHVAPEASVDALRLV